LGINQTEGFTSVQWQKIRCWKIWT
jgi:hypothetical protein